MVTKGVTRRTWAWSVIIVLVLAAFDALLWSVALRKEQGTVAAPWIGAASGLAVATVAFIGALLGTWRAHVYAAYTALSAERRTAYSQLLGLVAQCQDARCDRDSATEEVTTAQGDVDAAGRDVTKEQEAALRAAARRLEDLTRQVSEASEGLHSLRGVVQLISEQDLRDAAEQLIDATLKGQDVPAARDKFLPAARSELGLPKPGQSFQGV
jgi:hypothetical protein